ncbi:MAG: TetR/AcrR family transcriptional regulator [Acidimicrobiales bacterium]
MKDVTDNIAAALPRAAAVFASRGMDGTRMEDIVEATGIPRPTLYYHFSSKEEILAWLLERLMRDLSVEIGHILDRDQPARERLHDVVRAYLGLFADHRELCTVLLTELGRITRIPNLADAIWATFHEPVRKLLHTGDTDGSLRAVDDEMTASAIFGAVTMVGLHYVVTGQPVDPDAMTSRLDDLLLLGLAPTRTSKGRKR